MLLPSARVPPRFLFAHPGDLHATPLSDVIPLLGAGNCDVLQLDSNKDDAALVDEFEKRLGNTPSPIIVGGFSLGARIAAEVALRQPVLGLVALSFPFHRHGQPQQRHGLATLLRVLVPTLVIQGTRDAHGTQAHVRNMGPLGPQVELMWLSDANHHWRSRGPQAPSVQERAKDAALAIQAFARTQSSEQL